MINYQDALESVLAWLLEAEDNLHKQAEISEDVQQVKQQFHTHEVNKIFKSIFVFIADEIKLEMVLYNTCSM